MPVLDFTQPNGSADVVLSKVGLEVDPANDASVYKVSVLMLLGSVHEAEVVGKMVPGLADCFDRAISEDTWKATTAVRPGDSIRVTLTAKEAGPGARQGMVAAGEPIIQGRAELLEIKATQSKRAQAVLVRLVFRGQGSMVAAHLADNLSRSVGMEFTRSSTQVSLFPAGASPTEPALPAVVVGMVAAVTLPDGRQVTGRVMSASDTLTLIERGELFEVTPGAVVSSFSFATDPDTVAALDAYRIACDERSVDVSWAALVQVLSSALDNLSGDVRVSAQDVQAALVLFAPAGPPVQVDVEVPVEEPDMAVLEQIPEEEPAPRRRRAKAHGAA